MEQFDFGLNLSTNTTLKRQLLDQMQQVVPPEKTWLRSLRPMPQRGAKAVHLIRLSAATYPLHAAVVHVQWPSDEGGFA